MISFFRTLGNTIEKKHKQSFMVFVLFITFIRLIVLWTSNIDLGPDEAQYWFWSRSLDFGYYSKPPTIAWIIAFTTGIFGHEVWAIRLASPLFHLGTALFLYALANHLYSSRAGFWVGTGWVILPGIVFSSSLISVDTPLLFFWSGSLLFLMRIIKPSLHILSKPHHPSALTMPVTANPETLNNQTPIVDILCLGVCLGLGMMTKYAMIYFVIAILAGFILVPSFRRKSIIRSVAIAIGIMLIIITPNILWNIQHGFQTVTHTADNANWQGNLFKPIELLEFLVSQIAIIGPFLLLTFLVGLFSPKKSTPIISQDEAAEKLLVLFCLTPLIIVSIQAFISRAHANWAATAYPAMLILAILWLIRTEKRWVLWLNHWALIGLTFFFSIGVSNFWLADAAGLSNAIKHVRGWDKQAPFIEQQISNYDAVMVDERKLTGEIIYYGGLYRGKPNEKPIIGWNSNNKIDSHYEAFHKFVPGQYDKVLYVTLNPDAVGVTPWFENVVLVGKNSVDIPRGRGREKRERTLYFFEVSGWRQDRLNEQEAR